MSQMIDKSMCNVAGVRLFVLKERWETVDFWAGNYWTIYLREKGLFWAEIEGGELSVVDVSLEETCSGIKAHHEMWCQGIKFRRLHENGQGKNLNKRT